MIWLYLLLLVFTASMAYASWSFIAWLPTRRRDLARLLTIAKLRPSDQVYELGCGDGRVAIYLADHSTAQITGLKISLPLYLIAKLRQLLRRRKNFSVRLEDLFRADLSAASLIYVFGIPDRLAGKLRPKLERELRPGARVLSYAFPIAGWQPVAVDQPQPDAAKIFIYRR